MLVVLLIGLFGGYTYLQWIDESGLKLSQVAESYKPSSGIVSSIANQTGVEDIADILYSQDEKNIKVYFGEFTVDIPKSEFNNPNIEKGLAQMELTYKITAKGKFMFFWRGQRVEETK